MANEMRYTRNGRTYKLVEDGSETIDCEGCAFWGERHYCPARERDGLLACTLGDDINRIFRETILSKLLYPFHKLVRAVIDVFYFSATGQGRLNKHQKDINN